MNLAFYIADVLIVVVGVGVVVYVGLFVGWQSQATALVDASADARRVIASLAAEVSNLTAVDDASTKALTAASERLTVAYSHIEHATTLDQVGLAKTAALDGLDHVREARRAIGTEQTRRIPARTTSPTAFRDAYGVQWSVRRQWWPFPELPVSGSADPITGTIAFVAWALFAVLWPFWVLPKLCEVSPWKVIVKRDLLLVRTEQISGWSKSQRRIYEIEAALKAGMPVPVTVTRHPRS